MKKLVWIFLALALLAGGGFYTFQRQETEQKQKLQVAVVSRETIEDIVSAQGKLEPKDYVDVGVQVSGQIKKLHVDIGDEVKTGQLLAELDPQSYQSKVQGDEAKVNALKAMRDQQAAQAAYDRLQVERAKKLIAVKATSQQDLEQKETALKLSEANVASYEAQIVEGEASLETDRISLGYTKIYAPMDGVVSDRAAREGQTLNANQTTPTVLQIANLDVMTIKAQVAEADVMRLKPGMESEFATLGSLDRKWKGTIRQILPTPETVNDVVLFDALIDVENKDRQLMNGMSTQNTFVVGRAENALVIPARALGRRVTARDEAAKGSAYMARVMKADGTAEEREVFVGLLTRAKAEIRSGLAEGEKVVVSGSVAVSGEKKNAGPPGPPGMARL